MESEYDKRAEDFLKETNTTFKVLFLKNDLYFDGDKETRDIYKITLKRANKKYTFKFGQSINDTEKGKIPSPYNFLACLTKNNPETFKDFCSSFGYDEDSRKAEKIYKAIVKEWAKISDLFNTEELDKLGEIN